jgi:hypothetical protein
MAKDREPQRKRLSRRLRARHGKDLKIIDIIIRELRYFI